MAVWTDVLDTSFNYPGIDIYQRLKDGAFNNYIARAQEGYVFYDTNADDKELDEDGNEVSVTYYYVIRIYPVNYNMANFSLVAVPRDSVPENMIFGVGGNDHVVA